MLNFYCYLLTLLLLLPSPTPIKETYIDKRSIYLSVGDFNTDRSFISLGISTVRPLLDFELYTTEVHKDNSKYHLDIIRDDKTITITLKERGKLEIQEVVSYSSDLDLMFLPTNFLMKYFYEDYNHKLTEDIRYNFMGVVNNKDLLDLATDYYSNHDDKTLITNYITLLFSRASSKIESNAMGVLYIDMLLELHMNRHITDQEIINEANNISSRMDNRTSILSQSSKIELNSMLLAINKNCNAFKESLKLSNFKKHHFLTYVAEAKCLEIQGKNH